MSPTKRARATGSHGLAADTKRFKAIVVQEQSPSVIGEKRTVLSLTTNLRSTTYPPTFCECSQRPLCRQIRWTQK
jgi:hypothetical protein